MPYATEQKLDYDLFDYDYDNAAPMQLDEAISKARELRAKSGGDVVYRVMPIDNKGANFRVVAVPREEIVSNFFNKFAHWMNNFMLSGRARKYGR